MIKNEFVGLNPCFNGRYSQRGIDYVKVVRIPGLNPCFNGRYSQSRIMECVCACRISVLILVLMEDTLRARLQRRIRTSSNVLILVLMEDTLRATRVRVCGVRGGS